jgi:hypothetical protein
MKKLLLLSITALTLVGCADKNNYEAAVIADLKREAVQDPKDYKVDPDKMADCIVNMSSQNMHGLFAFDPERLTAYRNYAKMLAIPNAADPKKAMEELHNDFGSAQEFSAARTNYIESQLECLATFVASSDEKVQK